MSLRMIHSEVSTLVCVGMYGISRVLKDVIIVLQHLRDIPYLRTCYE